MKTKAAILEESKAPLIIDEIEIPKLDIGQVLVHVHRSGICGAQINEIDAVKGPDKFLPHLLGHEGGGIVVDVGPGVTQVQKDDHVVLHWRKGAGIQPKTPQYKWNGRTVNAGWVTTFNEYGVIAENRLTKIPKDIPFEVAALMGCCVTTALGLINNDAQVKIGQSVVVIGCGGVGLPIVQGASMVSANPIIGIDVHDFKLESAKRFGATHVIHAEKEDVAAKIKEICGPQGADVFVETTGKVPLIEMAYALTAKQGRTVLVGVPRSDKNINIHSLPLHFGKVLTGCEGGQTDPTVDIPKYLSLYKTGKLLVDELITHRFSFEEINTALDSVRKGQVGRCIVNLA